MRELMLKIHPPESFLSAPSVHSIVLYPTDSSFLDQAGFINSHERSPVIKMLYYIISHLGTPLEGIPLSPLSATVPD